MSVKVNTFTELIANPQNTHNFRVSIPDINYSVLVESTTFPSQKLREVKLYFQGEAIKYPTLPEETTTWQVTLPEGEDAKVYKDFRDLASSLYDQKSGIVHVKRWKDVIVSAMDMAGNPVMSVVLHGAWLGGRDAVTLDSSAVETPWKWVYEFHYQWIEDL